MMNPSTARDHHTVTLTWTYTQLVIATKCAMRRAYVTGPVHLCAGYTWETAVTEASTEWRELARSLKKRGAEGTLRSEIEGRVAQVFPLGRGRATASATMPCHLGKGLL